MTPLLVFVTASNSVEAERIAKTVVRERLAACVNAWEGVQSTYWWEGKMETARETILVIKTSQERFKALERRIRSVHSYSVPEIVAVRIREGSKPYLKWMKETLKK